jgi:hypothetical protein
LLSAFWRNKNCFVVSFSMRVSVLFTLLINLGAYLLVARAL